MAGDAGRVRGLVARQRMAAVCPGLPSPVHQLRVPGAAGLPGLGVGLLLAEEERSGSILSSQMLVMLPTFLFAEANSKHLFFF